MPVDTDPRLHRPHISTRLALITFGVLFLASCGSVNSIFETQLESSCTHIPSPDNRFTIKTDKNGVPTDAIGSDGDDMGDLVNALSETMCANPNPDTRGSVTYELAKFYGKTKPWVLSTVPNKFGNTEIVITSTHLDLKDTKVQQLLLQLIAPENQD